jgi:hypothetical protein
MKHSIVEATVSEELENLSLRRRIAYGGRFCHLVDDKLTLPSLDAGRDSGAGRRPLPPS